MKKLVPKNVREGIADLAAFAFAMWFLTSAGGGFRVVALVLVAIGLLIAELSLLIWLAAYITVRVLRQLAAPLADREADGYET